MKTERVDDIPIIVAELEKSRLSKLLNEHFPDHGNWTGTTSGKIAVGFLCYILSCADHRLSHVEQWAEGRLTTLQYTLGVDELSTKDFTDDKLGKLLDKYSDDEQWNKFEHAHNQGIINIYNLNTENQAVRLDAMITQSHRQAEGDFQFGHSKQHRSDLPQLKTMVATLDPLSMPLYSKTVAGNTADDVLYEPVIDELVDNLSLSSQLFVGDSKMGSLNIRAKIIKCGNSYLMPLNLKQCSKEQLRSYLSHRPDELTVLSTKDKKGKVTIKAKAFEVVEKMTSEALSMCWEERRVVVYSPSYAKSQTLAFENRLAKAQQAIEVLTIPSQGRKQPKSLEDLDLRIRQICKKYKVTAFIDYQIEEQISFKEIRKYKDRPQRIEKKSHFELQLKINQAKKDQHVEQLGWRVYACTTPKDKLNTRQVVECYRNEYKIEHKFNELLHKITALMPVYLHKPHRIKALIRLLLVGLKFVSLFEHQVREELKNTKQNIKELYPGNPGRSTKQPTTKLLLRAFREITLVIIPIEDKIVVKLTQLKPIQLKILKLLNIDPEIYLGLNKLSFSYFDFSET